MAAPHAIRPRRATLLGAVAAGIVLSWLLHRAVPVAAAGPHGELLHVAVAPLAAVAFLIAACGPTGRVGVDRRSVLMVLVLAAAGHEGSAVLEELVVHGRGAALGHVAHAAPSALALLVPALLAAAGVSWALVHAVGRSRTAGRPLVVLPLAVRGPGAAGRCTHPQAPRSGRSAGRAPPRLRTA